MCLEVPLLLMWIPSILSITVKQCPELPDLKPLDNNPRYLMAKTETDDRWDEVKFKMHLILMCFWFGEEVRVSFQYNKVLCEHFCSFQEYRKDNYLIISTCKKDLVDYKFYAMLIYEGDPIEKLPMVSEFAPVVHGYMKDIVNLTQDSYEWNMALDKSCRFDKKPGPKNGTIGTTSTSTTRAPEEGGLAEEGKPIPWWILYPIALGLFVLIAYWYYKQ